MKPRAVSKFYKIRDKRTGWFVTKGVYREPGYWMMKPDTHYENLREKDKAKENYSPYAELGIIGRSYSTLSGAMRMVNQLANQIVRKDGIDRTGKTDLTIMSQYFDLVEFEVVERRVIDS